MFGIEFSDYYAGLEVLKSAREFAALIQAGLDGDGHE